MQASLHANSGHRNGDVEEQMQKFTSELELMQKYAIGIQKEWSEYLHKVSRAQREVNTEHEVSDDGIGTIGTQRIQNGQSRVVGSELQNQEAARFNRAQLAQLHEAQRKYQELQRRKQIQQENVSRQAQEAARRQYQAQYQIQRQHQQQQQCLPQQQRHYERERLIAEYNAHFAEAERLRRTIEMQNSNLEMQDPVEALSMSRNLGSRHITNITSAAPDSSQAPPPLRLKYDQFSSEPARLDRFSPASRFPASHGPSPTTQSRLTNHLFKSLPTQSELLQREAQEVASSSSADPCPDLHPVLSVGSFKHDQSCGYQQADRISFTRVSRGRINDPQLSEPQEQHHRHQQASSLSFQSTEPPSSSPSIERSFEDAVSNQERMRQSCPEINPKAKQVGRGLSMSSSLN